MNRVIAPVTLALVASACGGAEAKPPTETKAIDYGSSASWVARPDIENNAAMKRYDAVDGSGAMASLVLADKDDTDVFWVHPTTHIDLFGGISNASITGEHAAAANAVVAEQAAALNGAGRVFAPRYRQVNGVALVSDGGQSALEVAWQDVDAAFAHYLAKGRAPTPAG